MNTLHLLNKAVHFAASVHRTQKRKGSDIPYITHPLSVSLILSRVTENENVVIAGILHDTIEDCEPYGSVTKSLIEQEFNLEIANIVNDLTEEDKTLPWTDRKIAAFKHIEHMTHESLLVKSADVLHNLSELNNDIALHGVRVFAKFNAPKAATVDRYEHLIPELRRRWEHNPLISELEQQLAVLVVGK